MTLGDQSQEQLVAQASYHQLFLAPLGVSPIYDGRESGPLVSVTDHATALIVVTGCAGGPVLVAFWTGLTPPPEGPEWQVQESVSITITEPLHLSSPTWSGPNRPVFAAAVPGPHRIRVSARGRGTHADLSVLIPSEHYLIEAWPEPSLRTRETSRDDGMGI